MKGAEMAKSRFRLAAAAAVTASLIAVASQPAFGYPPAANLLSLTLSANQVLLGSTVTVTADHDAPGTGEFRFSGKVYTATFEALAVAAGERPRSEAVRTFKPTKSAKYTVTAVSPDGELKKAALYVVDRVLPRSGQAGSVQRAVITNGKPGSVIRLTIGKVSHLARVKYGTTKTVMYFRIPAKGYNTVRMTIGKLTWPVARIRGY